MQEHCDLVVGSRESSGQTFIPGQGQRSLRSGHERTLGHHILNMYIFPEFLIYGLRGCLLDRRLYVICNPQSHWLTCWFCVPQDQFEYKSSELQEMAAIVSWEMFPHSWTDGILSLFYNVDILFLLCSWPLGTRACAGTRPELHLAQITDVLVEA